MQVKYSMRLDDKSLVLTDKGGQYILKPIPLGQFKILDQAPANELFHFVPTEKPMTSTYVTIDGQRAELSTRRMVSLTFGIAQRKS